MATVVDIGFRDDGTVFPQADWDEINGFFYNDEAETDPVDFSGSTFSGELLDKREGEKLFDLSFNTPADDGNVYPQLTAAQTATLIDRKTVWYWVLVTTGTDIDAYFTGELTVNNSFVAGS